jgi:PncC family amidohydrolase
MVSIEELSERLRAAGLTVAVAESSSGGLIAAEMSRLPGSSAYFRGGIVAYDAEAKTRLLGMPQTLFVEHGSVSAAAAQAMAEAARRLFEADVGIGETSIAGPGGATEGKPAGLSYVAAAHGAGAEVREATFTGTRAENRLAAVDLAARLLAELVPSP